MATVIIGAIITTLVSIIGSRIALWRAKLWLDENKHKVKWEIIYTIFGPDPNKPPVVVPPTPDRQPWFPNAPWNRRRKQLGNAIYGPVEVQPAKSKAEQYFHVAVSLPVTVGAVTLWWIFGR